MFFVSGCKDCQYCSIHSVPVTVIKFLIIFIFVELLVMKFFQSCSARTGFTLMHDAFVAFSVANDLLDQVFVCHVPVHCINQQHNILMSTTNVNRVSHFSGPARTHHLGLKAQNFENPIFTFGCFSLKAVYNSCKLQRLLQVTKFLIMYSFTHTNIVFLFRHLSTEIAIFINVCYQMKCFSGDSFSFFRSRFC